MPGCFKRIAVGIAPVWVCFAFAVSAPGAPAEIILQRGSQIEVSAAVYSPDGRIIASAGESETIRLWERDSGEVVRTLAGHFGERVLGLAFSPDGNFLASCGNNGNVKVWDYRSGRLVHWFTNHIGHWTRRVAFSPDSRFLVAASYDGQINLWNAASGAVALTLPTRKRVADVTFTPDGRWVVTASREAGQPHVRFWDTTTGVPGLTLNHSNAINSVAVSRNGKMLACGGDGGVSLWELPSGRWLRRIRMPDGNGAVLDVDLSADGSHLLTSGAWVNRAWSTGTGELLFEMRGHEDLTIQVSFAPDEREILSGSSDASVRQWDARTGQLRRILAARPPETPVTCVAFSPDGRFEAVAAMDGVVRVWDGRDGGFVHTFRGHEAPVQTLAFTPDSAWLCSGSADRTMRVWDMRHGTISAVQPLDTFRADVIGVVAAGGKEGLVAFASGPWGNPSLNRDIQLWQTHYERPRRVLRGHAANVWSIAYAPGADRLASADAAGAVKLWDSRRGNCLVTMTNPAFTQVLAWSPDGSALAAGLADGTVRVLSPETLAVSRQWPAHGASVQSLAFSGDGRRLATAGADRTVAVWTWETGAELRRFTNVTSQFLPVAFHPKKPVLVFARRDEMVVHASVETGEILFQRVLFPDGDWLAWNPDKALYMSSPRGHEHARVRFANQLVPVYPLEFYQAELSRQTNFLAALAGPAPVIAPKNFRLWWHRHPYKQTWLYGGLGCLGAWVIWRLRWGWIAERRRRAQERISRQLLVSQEAERKRIAAELHDGLGQNLLIIKNRLYLAQQAGAGPGAPEQLQEISQVVTQTIQEVREISHNLRPYQLDRLGLTKAMQSVVKKVTDSGSLRIESEVMNIDGIFTPESEINLYRIVQESLNNILKHSDAATARISIRQTDGRVIIGIEDDGRGFDYRRAIGAEKSSSGFGLTGLRERARILGGEFRCDSAPGRGTRLLFEIPIPEKHENGNPNPDG